MAAGTDPVTTRLLQALHEAYSAVGETDRTKSNKWANYFSEWDNPRHEASRRRRRRRSLLVWTNASLLPPASPVFNSTESSEAPPALPGARLLS